MVALRCHRCDATGGGDTLDWSSTVTEAGTRHLCGACTRHHVRDIEAKIDEAWWTPDSPTDP